MRYELTWDEPKMNYELIKSELVMNYELTINGLQIHRRKSM
jgi:hypothetical protein